MAFQSGCNKPEHWDSVQHRLQPHSNQSTLNNIHVMDHIHHLIVKKAQLFRCRPRVEDYKLIVEISVPYWVHFDNVQTALVNWESIKKITVYDLPTATIHSLINLIGSTKDCEAVTFLKLQGCVVHPDYLRYFISACPNLSSIYLPETTVLQGMNLLDFIVPAERLENLDLLTTVGIRVPVYIFEWLQRKGRVFRIFYIWPNVVIHRDHLYTYIPYWETYLTFESRHNSDGNNHRKQFNAAICIRTDRMLPNRSVEKKELEQWMTFLVDMTNNFFKSQLKHHGEFRAKGEASHIRTTVRAKHMPGKCVFFDIPSTMEFDRLADAELVDNGDSDDREISDLIASENVIDS